VSFEGPVGVGAGWQEIDGWTPDAKANFGLRLGADGTLTRDGVDGTVGLRQPASPDDPSGRAAFESAPLTTDHVLLGRAEVQFAAQLDREEAHLYVELLDIAPDGSWTVVNDGFLAASHHRSHSSPEPVVTGEYLELTIGIRPHHHRFVAGHRVGLRLSSGDPAALTPPPAPVTVTIYTGQATMLALPGFHEPV
jgi:predicted acyl esterase